MAQNGQVRDQQEEGRRRHLRSMLSDSVYVTAGQYAMQGFSFLIVMLLTRKLSVETYGIYGVILAAYAFSTSVLSLGIQPIIQRYLPEMLAKRDRRSALRLQWIGALGHLAASAIILLICLAFRGPIMRWATEAQDLSPAQFAQLLPYFFLFTIFKFEAAVFEEMLTAHRSQLFRNLVLAGFQALKFALFYFFLPHNGSAGTLMSYLVLSNLLLAAAFAARVLGLSRRIPDAGHEPLPRRRMLRFGLLRYVNTATYASLWGSIDILFVKSIMKDYGAVGLYAFAVQIISHLVKIVPTSELYTVLVPVYVREYTLRKDAQQLVKVFRFYNKIVTIFFAPMLVGALILVGPIISEFFDPKFLPCVTAFQILFTGMFIYYFLNTSGILLVILEKPEITLYSRLFIIYNIIMFFVLIPRFGIVGAALSTASANTLGYSFTYLMIKRHIAIRIPWLATLRTFLYTGLMALVIWPLAGWIDSILKLLLVVCLGAAVYVLLAWRLPVFDREERERLNTAVGLPVFRV